MKTNNPVVPEEIEYAVPPREQAIANYVRELEQKTEELLRLNHEYAVARWAELEARVKLFRAELIVQYGPENRFMEIDQKQAIKDRHQAKAELDAAALKENVLMRKKWTLYEYELIRKFPGYNWQDRSNFEALAAAAVQQRWGEHYRVQHLEETKARLGLSDDTLRLMVNLPKEPERPKELKVQGYEAPPRETWDGSVLPSRKAY